MESLEEMLENLCEGIVVAILKGNFNGILADRILGGIPGDKQPIVRIVLKQ